MATAVIAPLMVAVTACGSDDDKGGSVAASSSASTGSAGGDKAPSGKTLTEAELKAALVTAQDLPGWDVKTGDPEGDGEADGVGEKTDKPECQPLIDLFTARPTSTAIAAVSKTDGSSATVHRLEIGQFDEAKATELLAKATAALPKCAQFTGTEPDGTRTDYVFKAGPALPFGEDAVTFLYGMDGEPATSSWYVTRSGSALLSAMPIDFVYEGTDPLSTPEDMIRTQFDKLVEAQKG
ncbi:MAG TPA: hypothetical protein VLH10_14805 [Yinghuangia sp.]|nr:hypothetical protein [Yinghuangia sp.]